MRGKERYREKYINIEGERERDMEREMERGEGDSTGVIT